MHQTVRISPNICKIIRMLHPRASIQLGRFEYVSEILVWRSLKPAGYDIDPDSRPIMATTGVAGVFADQHRLLVCTLHVPARF
jgi:hypothetical protein